MKMIPIGLMLLAGCMECGGQAPTIECARVAALRTAGGPLVQAHRGGGREYDDNAAGGIRRGLDRGVRGFVVDVRFSKDHELVLMHDERIERTTDGQGRVEDLTLAELRNCRLQICAEPIPTLAEAISALAGRDEVFVELAMMARPGEFYTEAVLEEYCQKLNAAAKRWLKEKHYVFTSGEARTLKMMRKVAPSASLGYITQELTEKQIATAAALGCVSMVAGKETRAAMVGKAQAAGMTVTLGVVQNAAEYALAAAKGANRVTSDYAVLLTRAIEGRRKKVVAMDLDATLCQHRSPIPEQNLAALKQLCEKYQCVMSGAGNAPRIYRQMGNFPIDIIGNYGMQIATAVDGEFRITRQITNVVDRAYFREQTDFLREKYGYTQYEGESLEFHASGMVTFGLLGTSPAAEHKVAFDPNRKKRRAMYREVCELFKNYSVYIGGSTSFDFAGKQYNKYDSTVAWAKERGYELADIVFIGDDFFDGGGDSHVRIKGMDYIAITDYRNFHQAVEVLLK